ncbi:MAG: alpha/beta fold hydrolase [Actinomycetota bacterium]|nr:alpha/beta fold hydrolase [Actinomycetota bacterium]
MAALAIAGAAVLVVLLGGAAWFYSGQIRAGALAAKAPAGPEYRVEVLKAGSGSVTLAHLPEVRGLAAEGIWGLRQRDGYGQLGRIEKQGDGSVIRAYRHLTGSRPRPGERVAVELGAYPSPAYIFGGEYDTISYKTDLGPTPAWLKRGRRRTWVVFVHGYNAPRTEHLRLASRVTREGYPALLLSYRNDPGAPQTQDKLRQWGQTEWRDVEGSVRYALDHGARRVALIGVSMGAAVVTSFLYESKLAERVSGVVLDSPALDFEAVVDYEAKERQLPVLGTAIPAPLASAAKALAARRYGIDWAATDYVRRSKELRTPALVVHGTADKTVPIAISEELARARPDLVELVRVPRAGHVEGWNYARQRYEREVIAFLRRFDEAQ